MFIKLGCILSRVWSQNDRVIRSVLFRCIMSFIFLDIVCCGFFEKCWGFLALRWHFCGFERGFSVFIKVSVVSGFSQSDFEQWIGFVRVQKRFVEVVKGVPKIRYAWLPVDAMVWPRLFLVTEPKLLPRLLGKPKFVGSFFTSHPSCAFAPYSFSACFFMGFVCLCSRYYPSDDITLWYLVVYSIIVFVVKFWYSFSLL